MMPILTLTTQGEYDICTHHFQRWQTRTSITGGTGRGNVWWAEPPRRFIEIIWCGSLSLNRQLNYVTMTVTNLFDYNRYIQRRNPMTSKWKFTWWRNSNIVHSIRNTRYALLDWWRCSFYVSTITLLAVVVIWTMQLQLKIGKIYELHRTLTLLDLYLRCVFSREICKNWLLSKVFEVQTMTSTLNSKDYVTLQEGSSKRSFNGHWRIKKSCYKSNSRRDTGRRNELAEGGIWWNVAWNEDVSLMLQKTFFWLRVWGSWVMQIDLNKEQLELLSMQYYGMSARPRRRENMQELEEKLYNAQENDLIRTFTTGGLNNDSNWF